MILLGLKRQGSLDLATHQALLVTIGVTTVCWVATAFLGPETDRQTLIDFYKKVRPFGPGWKRIREAAGISVGEATATHENIPLALLGWSAGCTVIWSSLFAVGNLLYGRFNLALLLLAVFVASGLVLLYVINKLWAKDPGAELIAASR
jgi:SSS family solute:Na+ symporter